MVIHAQYYVSITLKDGDTCTRLCTPLKDGDTCTRLCINHLKHGDTCTRLCIKSH